MAERSTSLIERVDDITGVTFQYVVDGSLAGLREHEEEIHARAFVDMNERHVTTSEGLLSFQQYDPDAQPGQRLDVVEVRVEHPMPISALEDMATSAYKGYPQVRKHYLRGEHRALFNNILLDMQEGRDFAFIFDHERVLNLPIGGVATIAALHHTAEAEEIAMPEYFARLTASKPLSRLQAFGMNVIDILALQGIADTSIPPTESVGASPITDEMRIEVNASLKEVRAEFQAAHPNVSIFDIISPSASTDFMTRRFMRHMVHMHPASGGTGDMLTHARILPASLNVSKPHPRIKIGRLMNPLEDRTGVHDVMDYLAVLAQEATGHAHKYHATLDLYRRAIAGRKRI